MSGIVQICFGTDENPEKCFRDGCENFTRQRMSASKGGVHTIVPVCKECVQNFHVTYNVVIHREIRFIEKAGRLRLVQEGGS